jgi:hypothetical protein
MPLSENEVMRKQTKSFIDEYPQSIVLVRADTESDGAGGVKSTLAPLPAQTLRQITQATNTGVFRRTIDGEEVQPDFVLLGEWDADIANGDWYMKEGAKHEIVYVRDDRRYETWAEVKYRG